MTTKQISPEELNLLRPRAYSVCFSILRNHEDAEDATQEALAAANKNIGSFKGGSTLGTWLHRIASNTALNLLKKRKTRPSLNHIGVDPLDLPEPSTNVCPATELARADLASAIESALASLSEDHRRVITAFDVLGHSHSHIAKTLSIPEATVRTRLHYARAQIRPLLQHLREQ